MLTDNLGIYIDIATVYIEGNTHILFVLCPHKPYFYFSSAILKALNENLELTVLT